MTGDAIRAQGVVWANCSSCGLPWPFPRGGHAEREWHCAVCANAIWAAHQRRVTMHQRTRQAIDNYMAHVGPAADWKDDAAESTWAADLAEKERVLKAALDADPALTEWTADDIKAEMSD